MLPPFFKTYSVFQRKHCEIACWAANWATPMLACAGGAGFFFRRLRAGFPPRSVRSETIGRGRQLPIWGRFSAKFRSFSAVSKRNFASKYAFDSIFQNLSDYLAEFFEIWQNFADFSTFAFFFLNFHKNCWFFKPIFVKILRLQRCKSMQIL